MQHLHGFNIFIFIFVSIIIQTEKQYYTSVKSVVDNLNTALNKTLLFLNVELLITYVTSVHKMY